MLQKIDSLEWDDGAAKGQYAPGAHSEYITIISRKRPADYREIALPPGVVLAREVEQPAADPFMPDWSNAPEWAQWSTVNWSGEWSMWQYPPHITEIWECGSGDMITLDDAVLDMTGLDWRNSLRHRPE